MPPRRPDEPDPIHPTVELWHELKPYILGIGDPYWCTKVSPWVICRICQGQIRTLGFEPIQSDRKDHPKLTSDLQVLPCGHFFCWDCWGKHFRAKVRFLKATVPNNNEHITSPTSPNTNSGVGTSNSNMNIDSISSSTIPPKCTKCRQEDVKAARPVWGKIVRSAKRKIWNDFQYNLYDEVFWGREFPFRPNYAAPKLDVPQLPEEEEEEEEEDDEDDEEEEEEYQDSSENWSEYNTEEETELTAPTHEGKDDENLRTRMRELQIGHSCQSRNPEPIPSVHDDGEGMEIDKD